MLLAPLFEVFHRRLPVHPCEEQGGEQRGSPLFDALEGDPTQIGSSKRFEALEEGSLCARHPEALEQQMVQAEGEVEGGVALPLALGVE
jgi:hypothetical protein